MSTETIQPIATEFTASGFHYRQIERRGLWALFEQSKGGRVTSFELVKVQERPSETIHGRAYPPRETFPRNELWGSEGFTIANREEALHRLEALSGKL